MAEIVLTRGQVALVDDEDFAWLNQWKWTAWWDPECQNYRAVRTLPKADGKRYILRIHRVIMGLEKGDKRQIDHINLNPLDNRRSNLRIATCAQNNRNQGKRAGCSSKYKGVSLYKPNGKWRAQILVGGVHRVLGLYETPEEAHAVYCEAAKQFHGEFARTA